MTQTSHKALVTLAVGDDYIRSFVMNARHTWNEYCNRHGYDLVMLTEPIDKGCDFTSKSIHWQKMLIGLLPRLRDYDHLVWVDGDILINHRQAPCIVSHLKEDGIGVVDISGDFRQSDDVFNLHARFLLLNHLLARQLGANPPPVILTDGELREYYRIMGFPPGPDRFINTGVLAFSPRRHAHWLAETYAKHQKDYPDFENTPLSYDLQASGRAEYLDGRFNLIWAQEVARNYPFLFNLEIQRRNPEILALAANTAFRNSWFLHFAGAKRNPVIKEPFRMIAQDAQSVAEFVFPEDWAKRAEFLRLSRLDELDKARDQLGGAVRDWMISF